MSRVLRKVQASALSAFYESLPSTRAQSASKERSARQKANNRGRLPYFLKYNATFAEISVKDINFPKMKKKI